MMISCAPVRGIDRIGLRGGCWSLLSPPPWLHPLPVGELTNTHALQSLLVTGEYPATSLSDLSVTNHSGLSNNSGRHCRRVGAEEGTARDVNFDAVGARPWCKSRR